ncbi:MAG: hypothetical protein V1702_05320, partial [Candidatus Woesearchaeota archaeon]
TSPMLQQVCQYGCSGGACTQQDDSCTDSDGGYNWFVPGTVSGYYYSYPYSYDDFCADDGVTVGEYVCMGTRADLYNVSCNVLNATGCSNGACY